jgi:putative flippase GtrA
MICSRFLIEKSTKRIKKSNENFSIMHNTSGIVFLKKLLQHQFVRYILVGGMNTAFGYGMYACFLWMGLHYMFATLLGTVFGVLFNFKTYGILVFKNRSNRLIFRYVAMYAFIYLCNNFWIFMFEKFAVNPYVSGCLWLIPNAALSFLLSRQFVYKKQ